MKKISLSILPLCLFISSLVAQNIVPNPSFENLKTTPSCVLSVPKAQFESTIYNWKMPTDATPDIYSTTMPSSCLSSQPNSTVLISEFPTGHQLPRTGNTMAGFAPYISQWYREYLSVKLSTPLVVGQHYCCRMYVSLAEGSRYAQNNLAMYFSDTLVYVPNAPYLNFVPQVANNEAITDSINWVEYKGSFIALSPSQYLIIGNFDPAAQNGQVYLGPDIAAPGNASFAYYFIDDISVEPLNPPTLSITGNQKVCPQASLQLQANGWEYLQWYNSNNQLVSTNETLTIEQAENSTYTVSGFYCNALLRQTVNIEVHELPRPDLGKDTMLCKNGTLVLDAGTGFNSYRWQNGATTPQFTATQEGTYAVQVSNNFGCEASDTIQLSYYPDPQVDLGEDFETCSPNGTLQGGTGPWYENYQWQDGSTNPSYDYTKEGTYWVKKSNICSTEALDSITIYSVNMFIPNLITPNNDQLNDRFIVQGLRYPKGTMEIYNSYGARVYYNEHYAYDWTGNELSGGIYYYTFRYPSCKEKKGWIHVFK